MSHPARVSKKCAGGALAAHLDLSVAAIAKLAKDGVIVRLDRGAYDMDASRINYIRHLRATAAGRGGVDAVESLSQERARLAKEQADGHAIKNAALRGEMVSVADVDATWSGIMSDVRAGILAIQSRVQQRVMSLTASDVAAIDAELREVLTALGNDSLSVEKGR